MGTDVVKVMVGKKREIDVNGETFVWNAAYHTYNSRKDYRQLTWSELGAVPHSPGGETPTVEGVPLSCSREETRKFDGLDMRPMKSFPKKPDALAFARRVREGALAFPFNAKCHTRVTREPSGYMVWAIAKGGMYPEWVKHGSKRRAGLRTPGARLTR